MTSMNSRHPRVPVTTSERIRVPIETNPDHLCGQRTSAKWMRHGELWGYVLKIKSRVSCARGPSLDERPGHVARRQVGGEAQRRDEHADRCIRHEREEDPADRAEDRDRRAVQSGLT